MGQRLNLEIKINGKSQANAYYHWSGYTSTSYRITSQVLYELKNINENDPKIKAIRLLETTGAGFNPEEILKVKEFYPNMQFKKCNSRNDGIISITPEGMKETRQWEEGRVTIDIDYNLVYFNVWFLESKANWKKWNENEEDAPKYEDIPVLDRSPYVFTFEDFKEFFSNEKNSTTNIWTYKNKVVQPIY